MDDLTNLLPAATFIPPQPDSTGIPAADIELPSNSSDVRHAAYPVKRPEQELNEFFVECRATTLVRCREKLTVIGNARFPWYELLLAISSLAFGTFFGALSSGITYVADPTHWKLLFVFMPMVGIGTGVAYLFMRHQGTGEVAAVARQILDELPDPNNSK